MPEFPTTLTAAAAALDRGRLTARELIEEMIRRAETRGRALNAFVSLDADSARRAADQADERRRSGRSAGPFDGVPIAVKDNIAVRGQPCTCASRILEGYISPYDATVIARLRALGFIFLGRTNMDEFAMGSTTETSAYGVVSNPWDPERVAGGSSGGSAAAVAAGAALAALGSDTGGSIRQPAAFCGVFGLKPTYGRVSRFGLVAYASSLDQIGPLTRSPEDAAVLLEAISGPDPRDSTTLPAPAPAFSKEIHDAGVRGLRIGLPREYLEVEGLDPEVRAVLERTARAIEGRGAELREVRLPHTRYAVAAYYIVATAEASANLARFEGIRYGRRVDAEHLLDLYRRTRAEGFGEEVKRRIILGTYALSSGYYDAYYLRAQKVRTMIRRDFTEAFQDCDLMLCPAAPTPAPRKGGFASPLAMYLADIYTIAANLAGICGLSVPAGRSGRGLPIGLQLLGPHQGETAVLAAARACAEIFPPEFPQ